VSRKVIGREVIGQLVAPIAALVLATAAPAAAQSPTQDAYGGTLPGVTTPTSTPPPTGGTLPTEVTSPPEEPAAGHGTPKPAEPVEHGVAAATGGLPFTGLELGGLIMAGLAMLAGGLAVRRATRSTA
jgi:hypothetical protein